MKVMEKYIEEFLQGASKCNIKKIIYTSSLEDSVFINKMKSYNFDCFKIEDARTAAYIATGMSAESNENIIVCTNGDNEYRSFMPGLTESFYRNLGIIAVTLTTNKKLNFDVEINDVINFNMQINCNAALDDYRSKLKLLFTTKGPRHIDFDIIKDKEYKDESFIEMQYESKKNDGNSLINELEKYVDDNVMLFIDRNISYDTKIKASILGSGANGYEGFVAYVLGASLSNNKNKYIGVISEKAMIHDINSLGNRMVNNRLVYFVYVDKFENTIADCAKSLGFAFFSEKEIYKAFQPCDKPMMCIVKEK